MLQPVYNQLNVTFMARPFAILLVLAAIAAVALAQEGQLAIELRVTPDATELELDAAARTVADQLGAQLVGRIGRVRGAYLLQLPEDDGSEHHERRARSLPDVAYAALQTPVVRTTREVYFEDPLFPAQWHLQDSSGHSIGAEGAWQKGLAGDGVLVAVVDDGLYRSHADIWPNYSAHCSYDYVRRRLDPAPTPGDRHGTRCAGEIAAAANAECGVGVAYRARLAGVRLLGGTATDATEAEALNHCLDASGLEHVAVYSNSWGPPDDGRTIDGPQHMAAAALAVGARDGRGGRGAVYVWAAGNGGENDNCNMDGFANSPYTITVGALADNDRAPYYQEPCAAMLVVAYSSGGSRAIATTDAPTGCTASHGGTSAAAPLVAGVVALILQSRPELTARDIQWVLALTARRVHAAVPGTKDNAFGLAFHPLYGFGVVDAAAAVALASEFALVAPEVVFRSDVYAPSVGMVSIAVPDTADTPAHVEHAIVTVRTSRGHRGDTAFFLVSPAGTQVQLLTYRPHDRTTDGLQDWALSTVAMWGEHAAGNWMVRMEVVPGASVSLDSVSLEVRGAAGV